VEFIDVASVGEIPDNGMLSVSLPSGEQVCLIRRGYDVSALRDECPHQGMALSAGEILPDGAIECAWHGARFDCRTGAVVRGPAESDAVLVQVRVDNGRVLVADRPLR